MEIERKFTIKTLPKNLDSYDCHEIEQAYLCTNPVVRIRREDDTYYLTYKGRGFIERQEENLPLNKEAFYHLLKKADGNIIRKKRYQIPLEEKQLMIELDIFSEPKVLTLAEIEFPTLECANSYIKEDWFLEDVTFQPEYQNSNMSKK